MGENTYKISVDLQALTFSADGNENAARADFKAFMTDAKEIALAKAHAAPAAAPALPPPLAPAIAPLPPAPRAIAPGAVDSEFMRRAFITRDGVVTLAALPQSGENSVPDAILALVFGYWKTTESTTITAIALAKALRLSGPSAKRIDRDIKPLVTSGFMTRSGSGRATRYGLTNTGAVRAEEIIRAIHG